MLKKFLRDRRGFGIVTVLIAVFCVAAMGTALLYTAYTGFQVKAAARKSTDSFYAAETAMDEIRAGLQQAASDCIGRAYTAMLANYADYVAEYEASERNETGTKQTMTRSGYLNQKFQDLFLKELRAWKYGNEALLTQDANTKAWTANPAVLKAFLLKSSRNSPALSEDEVTVEADEANQTITLTGVKLTCAGENGYETLLTTDLRIRMPSFSDTSSGCVTPNSAETGASGWDVDELVVYINWKKS